MPKFAYTAYDEAGAEQYGILEAASEADAINELGRRNLIPTEVRPANITDNWRVKRKEQIQERQAVEARRQERAKKRHQRQRLVVHYKDGRIDRGVCFSLNPKDVSFYLDSMDVGGESTGKTVQVHFDELKGVFYVKSFDGKFDKKEIYRDWVAEGTSVVVEFQDGEVIKGSTLHPYNARESRFHLIPEDPATNNISILVEASSVVGVYTPEEYKAKKTAEREARRKEHPEGAALSQDETMGDFYFETRNYEQALEHYRKASKEAGDSGRLRKKVLASQFNIGVQHIKRREYPQALECMEKVLKVDPANEHAKKKVGQLRRILEKEKGTRQSKTFEADF